MSIRAIFVLVMTSDVKKILTSFQKNPDFPLNICPIHYSYNLFCVLSVVLFLIVFHIPTVFHLLCLSRVLKQTRSLDLQVIQPALVIAVLA